MHPPNRSGWRGGHTDEACPSTKDAPGSPADQLGGREAARAGVSAVAVRDSAAGAVYRYASENNLAIPADISVIGYYNTPWCGVYEPALTSISIREDEIAKSVVERILSGDARPAKKIIEPVLIKRDS